MSPERANIFVAEDKKVFQEIVREELQRAGHKVVILKDNFKEALAAIDSFEEKGVEVAVLDGNLGRGFEENHGKGLARLIREKAPWVKIIGIGTMEFEGVDINLTKMRLEELGETVNEL